MSNRASILGVEVDRVDLSQTEEILRGFSEGSSSHQITTVNLDFLAICQKDPGFRSVINSSSLVVPDGMPILWAARFLGDQLPRRITGSDLVHLSSRLAAERGHGMFLLGAAPGVAEEAGRVLADRYLGLKIAGSYSPPLGDFSPEENDKMIRLVRESGANYLFVALGTPKQEYWIADHIRNLGVSVAIGVGGVFNFLAGRVRRAPATMQNLGLEWFYRLMQEPNRLAKRYFVDDLPVLMSIMGSRMVPGQRLQLLERYVTTTRFFHF